MSENAAEEHTRELARELRRDLDAAEAARSRYLEELTGTAARHRDPALEATPAAESTTGSAVAVLTDRSLPDAQRVEVVDRLGGLLSRRPEHLDTLLAVVTDRDESPAVRAAVLRMLGAASFQVVRFRPHRGAYVDALRSLVADPDLGLRETATSILATEHDGPTQQLLLDGLSGAGPLPVERATAIALLAEDDHLDNLPWLHELYRSADEGDREAAVRHMGSYPAATDDLEAILRDKDEVADVREQSAASLRHLAPERFDAAAKEIALDADDDPEVRAACLQALHQLGGDVYADTAFVDRVAGLDPGSAPEVAAVARDLLAQRPDR